MEKPQLWNHQKEAILRGRFLDCFALFFEPGTGKSRTTIELLSDKYSQNDFRKKGAILNTLILCPLVVVEQWKREFEKYSNISQTQIFTMIGNGQKKFGVMKAVQEDFRIRGLNHILITNYETLYNTIVMPFIEKWVEVLVCDESSRLKEQKAKRTKISIKLADKCKCRYILSGTPILGSQLDIFTQFRILDNGKTFGKNYFAFRAKYFKDKNASWKGSHSYFPDWVPREDCSTKIQEEIRPLSMVVKKEEVLDLPPLVKEEIFVELSLPERRAYNSMRDSLIAFLNDKACVAEMALTKCLRLQQMVSGFMKFDDDSEKSFPEFAKLAALSELLEDIAPSQKIIVWCTFKKNYADIKNVCEKLGLSYAELHGEIPDKDAEVTRFTNDNTCRVLIANPQAGGLGISLTVAGYSIFYSRGFSLEADIQAEARNYRGGTLEAGHKKVTRIDLIVRDSIDELVLNAIKMKLQTANEILGMLKQKL